VGNSGWSRDREGHGLGGRGGMDGGSVRARDARGGWICSLRVNKWVPTRMGRRRCRNSGIGLFLSEFEAYVAPANTASLEVSDVSFGH
jgi:hypothetical protein